MRHRTNFCCGTGFHRIASTANFGMRELQVLRHVMIGITLPTTSRAPDHAAMKYRWEFVLVLVRQIPRSAVDLRLVIDMRHVLDILLGSEYLWFFGWEEFAVAMRRTRLSKLLVEIRQINHADEEFRIGDNDVQLLKARLTAEGLQGAHQCRCQFIVTDLKTAAQIDVHIASV